MSFEVPGIQTMLDQVKQRRVAPWLRSLETSLMPPGRGLLRTLIGHTYEVNTVAVTPEGKRAISGSADETLNVWNLETGEELFTLTGQILEVTAVAVTPDGKLVISGSWDKTIKVWDLETREQLFTLPGHTDVVNAVAVTPDGKQIISSSDDNTLRVWDLSRREFIASFSGESALKCCAVASDGVTIVAGEASGRVHFLRLEGV